ncbi:uncharacterized protein BDV14DRAFT_193507 [Aspergillus stella-maris]|uniref:uncharacterized protein n=1 Tax=Aspergillus stella-maris TaxID=1810926 RepID=UPI003CCDD619
MLETIDTKHYTVAWFCVHPIEEEIARGMLDETHKSSIQLSPSDPNNYTLGRLGRHKPVIARLPAGTKSREAIGKTVKQVQFTLPSTKLWLLVGTGSGIPNPYCDIRLGDVVVGTPGPMAPGVVEITVDGGDRLQRTGYLLDPLDTLITASATLRNDPDLEGSQIPLIMNDLFSKHPDLLGGCSHPGQRRDILFRPDTMAVEIGVLRNQIGRGFEAICLNAEATAVMQSLPALVICSVADYADSHKTFR